MHASRIHISLGTCRLVLAVPDDCAIREPQSWPPVLRLGTKFPRATASYMAARGQAVEIVPLHGSVELAPLVGLTDGIADLTATGTTLRENRLRVVAEMGRSTARLIGNPASLKTRSERVQDLVARLKSASHQTTPAGSSSGA